MNKKNDYGASHWSSKRVWDRRKAGQRTLNKIQCEILLEFLEDHRQDIQKSPYRVALQTITAQLREAELEAAEAPRG